MLRRCRPQLIRFTDFLFIALLVTLPFAEWRFLVLPTRGKSFGIDFTGYRSCSPFDVLLALFVLSLLFEAFRRSTLKAIWKRISFVLLPLSLLSVITIFATPFSLPWLTPLEERPLDVRSLLLHSAVAVAVASYLLLRPFREALKVLKGALWYYSILFFALILVTKSGVPLLEANYPFQARFTLSFPFPVQNLTAPFLSLCAVQACALLTVEATVRRRISSALSMVIPITIFLTASTLTGSRSSFFLETVSLVGFFTCVLVAFRTDDDRSLARPRLTIALSLLFGLFVAFCVLNWDFQPVQRSLSLFAEIAKEPTTLLFGDSTGVRGALWDTKEIPRTQTDRPADPGSPFGPAYRVSILVVKDGCLVETSEPISDLQPDIEYKIRFQTKGDDVTLDVSDPDGTTRTVGAKTRSLSSLSDLLVVGLDSDDTRRKSARISVKNLRIVTETATASLSLTDSRFEFRDRFYSPTLDSSTGHLRLSESEVGLELMSWDSIRSSVMARKIFAPESKEQELDFDLTISSLQNSVETTEFWFATGFISAESINLEGIRDAMLIRFAYSFPADQKAYVARAMHGTIDRFAYGLRVLPMPLDEVLGRLKVHYSCRPGTPIPFSELVDRGSPLTYHLDEGRTLTRNVLPNHPGYLDRWDRLDSEEDRRSLSLMLPDNPQTDEYLAGAGGTLSVYRDVYKSMGPLVLMGLLGFIGSVLLRISYLTWKGRKTASFPVALAGLVQICFLTLYLYPQPFLFVKFYWFFIGLAVGLASKIANGEEASLEPNLER